MEKLVHVLGNSHVRYFFGRYIEPDSLTTYSPVSGLVITGKQLGSTGATIFGLENVESESGARVKIDEYVQKERPDVFVLVLGEVDCRVHITAAADKNDTQIETEVAKVVGRYSSFITTYVKPYVRRLILFSSIPYTYEFHSHFDKRIMLVGAEFNFKLRKLCEEIGAEFLSVLPEAIDETGFLRKELYLNSDDPGEIHLHYERTRDLILPKLESILASEG